jgi:hypothetical protein
MLKILQKIAPFILFSYDTQGVISLMFYLSKYNQKHGDIICDLGFTKLFHELKEEGTLCYIQNITSLTVQYENRYFQLGSEDPKIFDRFLFLFLSIKIFNLNTLAHYLMI